MYFHAQNVEVIINDAPRGSDVIPARNKIQSETENKGVTVNLKGVERLISLSDDPNSNRVSERSSTTAGTTFFSNDLVRPGFPPRDRQPVTPPRDRGPRPTRN